MRKKSHILLARYLADQMPDTASLQSHRKAFCFGSILPDIKPSFITRRHEFFGTFEDVKAQMKELVDTRLEAEQSESLLASFWRSDSLYGGLFYLSSQQNIYRQSCPAQSL